MKGQVKWFSLKKGYGFITGEDSKDYFFHYTMMPHGVLLKEEDSINFEVLKTEKGLQAKDITLSDAPVIVAKDPKTIETEPKTIEEESEVTKEVKPEPEAESKPAPNTQSTEEESKPESSDSEPVIEKAEE